MRLFICRVLLLEISSTASLASCSTALTVYVRFYLNTVGLASCSVPTLPCGCRIKLFITIHRTQLCVFNHSSLTWNCYQAVTYQDVCVQSLHHLLSDIIQHISCLSPTGYSTDFQDQCHRYAGVNCSSSYPSDLSICVTPFLAESNLYTTVSIHIW